MGRFHKGGRWRSRDLPVYSLWKQIPYHRILLSHQKKSKVHVEAVIAFLETGGIIEHNQTPSPEIVDNSNPIEGGGDAEMSDLIENID
jgi:hypothetical protein